jgi:mRNA interferase RelE/StbE
MIYKVLFPNHSTEKKFAKLLAKIPQKTQDEIMKEIEQLAENPYPYGKKLFKKISPPILFYQWAAQYRIRIGDFRVLYDVAEGLKIVWILALRKRGEGTYQ